MAAALLRAGWWLGLALVLAGPGRALIALGSAPTVLLSLRDADRVVGASRLRDQSLVSVGGEPRVAIDVSLPARIEWSLRLRPGRHRIDTAVSIRDPTGASAAPMTLSIQASEGVEARTIASLTIEPPRGTPEQAWHPIAAELDTRMEPVRLALVAEADALDAGAYVEAPRIAALTDPPRFSLVFLGLVLLVACQLAARRRAISLGFARNPLVWIAYTLCVAALLLEGALRLVGWRPVPSPVRLAVAGAASAAWMDATIEDPDLGYRYRPGLSMTWPWRSGDEPRTDVHFETDADGFRNPPGITSPRIVVVGDSYIEGDLVDEPQTMRSRLADETGAEVRNLALSGYGPQQYAIAARRFGLPARPAVVVVALFEGNDLGDAEIFGQWRRSQMPWNDYVLDVLQSRRGTIVFRPHLGLRTLDALVAIRSGVWGLLVTPPEATAPANPFDRRCERDPAAPDCMRFDAGLLYGETRSADEWSAGVGWALTRAALLELRDACRDAGARLIVVLVPTKESLYVPRAASSISPAAFNRLVGEAAGVAGPYFDRFLANHGALDRVIEPFLRGEGIDVLNLRPVFSRAEDQGRRLYYRLDMHWNALGHEEAARAIAAGLRALGWSEGGVLPPGA